MLSIFNNAILILKTHPTPPMSKIVFLKRPQVKQLLKSRTRLILRSLLRFYILQSCNPLPILGNFLVGSYVPSYDLTFYDHNALFLILSKISILTIFFLTIVFFVFVGLQRLGYSPPDLLFLVWNQQVPSTHAQTP